MSSNLNTDEINTDSNHAEPNETMDVQTAQRVEQEKMTRRAALRKFGFGAGMAAFAMLGVDDFARMVGKRMERMAGDNKVAGQIAKEFESAGIVLAAGSPSPSACNVPGVKPCTGLNQCQCCGQTKICSQATCAGQYTINRREGMSQTQAAAIEAQCNATATAVAAQCCSTNNCNC